MQESVILVNEHDQPTGTMEKMEAHRQGLLHRAFSVFVFNDRNELLLQRRALSKYHSAGLWTNTCCSHPRPGEDTEAAAHRRLQEEMGFDCALELKTTFVYKTLFDNGLTEHEFDYVFTGTFNHDPVINREEAEGFAWRAIAEIKRDMIMQPGQYTSWFRIALQNFF